MTPKIIELKQAPVVLVELSEGADYKVYGDKVVIGSFKLSRTEYKGLGVLSALTEDQFAECVDRTKTHPKYWNYNLNYFREFRASDSFYSLLESEKVYTENPYRHPDKIYTNRDDSNIFQKHSMKKWQEAQQRTIDPTRTVVLLRKEDVKCI